MNENLLPQTLAIKDWLVQASGQLVDTGITSAKLDAELILANALNQERTYLHAHPEQIIYATQLKIVNKHLAKRLKKIPIAYITGYKEFYGRNFSVTTDTLIPRPESEAIISLLKQFISNQSQSINLVDVGAGSGCLGITAKLEFSNLNVKLIDISKKALIVASNNAKNLVADVTTLQSNLLENYLETPDVIIANLPYVDKSWDRSPDTKYEPALALFADNNGLSIIQELITQANNLLPPTGYLIIEADPSQHKSLIKFAKRYNFELVNQLDYALAFRTQ